MGKLPIAQPTHRAKWKSTGRVFCHYPSEEIAKALFPSVDRIYAGELVLEKIPEPEEQEPQYGRDAYEN